MTFVLGLSATDATAINEWSQVQHRSGQDTVRSIPQDSIPIGYGTQKSNAISSAVSSLRFENFNVGNIHDPVQLMQGRMPGVSITKPGSDPNGTFTVRIRGVNTLSANQQPLYVIDGFIGASMANLDPADIASFQVLKDGSAAAIYGMQGSGGVVLVTTKKGSAGELEASFSSYVAVENMQRKIPSMSADQFIKRGGQNLFFNTNWMDEVTRTAFSVVNNLSLGGGTGKSSWRFSINVRNAEGILRKSGFNQLNARFSVQQTALKGKLKFQFGGSAITRNSDYSFPEAMRYAVSHNPTSPILVPSSGVLGSNGVSNVTGGPYAEQSFFDYFNPVAIINQNSNTGLRTLFSLNGKIDMEIVPGLTGTLLAGLQRENEVTGQYYSKFAYFRGYNSNGLAIRNTHEAGKEVAEMYMTYQKRINQFNLVAAGGYSFQQKEMQGYGISAGGFLSDALGYNALSYSQDVTNGKSSLTSYASPHQRLTGYFGRVMLGYREKFFLNVSLRNEGYSGLGSESKRGNFAGISGAVALTSSLKIRVGWGSTGALPADDGASQSQYAQLNGLYYYSNGTLSPAVANSLAPNPLLSWEKKTEFNVGADFRLSEGRLSGSMDLYQRLAKDFVMKRPIDPSVNTAPFQFQNLGEIRTTGIELSLSYAAMQRTHFSWSTSLMVAWYRSQLVSLYPQTASANGSPEPGSTLGSGSSFAINNIDGEQVGTIVGPKYLGVDANGSALLGSDPYSRLGHGLPALDLGWSNYFTYKRFDLNFLLRGSYGHSLVNSFRYYYETAYFIPYNSITTKYYNPALSVSPFSSLYVENAGFVKLDNLSLGYSFHFGNGSLVSRLRAYVGGNNLFVITGYTGNDPEARVLDSGSSINGYPPYLPGNALAPGIDRRDTYLLSRTFVLGFQLTF